MLVQIKKTVRDHADGFSAFAGGEQNSLPVLNTTYFLSKIPLTGSNEKRDVVKTDVEEY